MHFSETFGYRYAYVVCIPRDVFFSLISFDLQLVLVLLRIRQNPYWLVKVELCELLGEMDFKILAFLEEQCTDLRRGVHHYMGVSCSVAGENKGGFA